MRLYVESRPADRIRSKFVILHTSKCIGYDFVERINENRRLEKIYSFLVYTFYTAMRFVILHFAMHLERCLTRQNRSLDG